MKPHKGRITEVEKFETVSGYVYLCRFLDHPQFAWRRGHTSLVVKDDCDKPRHKLDSYEIETRNSRYTVVLKETVEWPLNPNTFAQ